MINTTLKNVLSFPTPERDLENTPTCNMIFGSVPGSYNENSNMYHITKICQLSEMLFL